MFTGLERRIVLVALLFLLPITAGLSAYIALEISETSELSARNSGYAQPKYIGGLVENLQQTLVTIECRGSSGSGFAFILDKPDLEYGFRFAGNSKDSSFTRIITNAHVIQDCQEDKKVNFVAADGKKYLAKVEIVDPQNDLALLSSEKYIEGISGVYWKPRQGYWVMGLGSPHNFAGSVTFGNIINFDRDSIFHTASLSPGSSGGPLVDNEGFLYGVNTGAKPVGQNFNISVSLNAFCDAIVVCPDDSYWEE
jgi:hypothetical protein